MEWGEPQLADRNRVDPDLDLGLGIEAEDIELQQGPLDDAFDGHDEFEFSGQFLHRGREFGFDDGSAPDISAEGRVSPAIDFGALENPQGFVHECGVASAAKNRERILAGRTDREAHELVEFGVVGYQQDPSIAGQLLRDENRLGIEPERCPDFSEPLGNRARRAVRGPPFDSGPAVTAVVEHDGQRVEFDGGDGPQCGHGDLDRCRFRADDGRSLHPSRQGTHLQ